MSKRYRYIRSVCCAAALIALSFSRATAATAISTCASRLAGSYLVTASISSVGISCLVFSTGPVTLDLGGFTVSGSGGTNGVFASGIANVTVRNGTLSGFARGVLATGLGAVIDGVRAVTGSANGITVGDNGTVKTLWSIIMAPAASRRARTPRSLGTPSSAIPEMLSLFRMAVRSKAIR
jgi:hypothetical protein